MMRYIFKKNEIKTLFYLAHAGDFSCSLFDVNDLTQQDFEEALEGLIGRNVVYRINNSDIKLDSMFEALVGVVYEADYMKTGDHMLVAVRDIAVVIEEDGRNPEILKLAPYRDMEEVTAYYDMEILL